MGPRTGWFPCLLAVALLASASVAQAGPVEDFLLGLVRTFGPGGVGACKAAANPLTHSAGDCDAAYRLAEQSAQAAGQAVDQAVQGAQECLGSPEECAAEAGQAVQQGFQTAAECLADLEGCLQARGEAALEALGAAGDDAFVTLSGRTTDEAGRPLAGVVVTATPVGAPALVEVASTHRTVSGLDGRWRIDVNRFLAFNGTYRVTASGPAHDFAPTAHEVRVGR